MKVGREHMKSSQGTMASKEWKKTTEALWALTVIWIAMAGMLLLALRTQTAAGAVVSLALALFFLLVLILKKQATFARALSVVAVVGIIGSAFFLAVLAGGGARNVFLLATPMVVVVPLMVLSLVFFIRLLSGALALRREANIAAQAPCLAGAAVSPGQMQSGVFPAAALQARPLHTSSFVLGLIALLAAIFALSFGEMAAVCWALESASLVCGVASVAGAYRARHDSKVAVGFVLGTIGLAVGIVNCVAMVYATARTMWL